MPDELPIVPYSEVRAHLAETLREVEARDEAVLISRRGEPAGVLMSVALYRRLTGGDAGFGQALQSWRDRHAKGLRADAAEHAYEDPFADVRDRRPQGGRTPFDWDEQPTPSPAPGRRKGSGAGRRAR